MDHMLVNADYADDVTLNQKVLDKLKPFTVIGVYASVQFINRLETVEKQLKDAGKTIITCQPERTNAKYQVLGCDNYKRNFKHEQEPEVYLYVGDGLFHPRALVIAQKDDEKYKDVICYDPFEDDIRILDEEHGKPIFRKYRGGLMKFMNAQNIGVFVTVKWGQQQFRISQKLEEAFPDKTFYWFVGDNVNRSELEHFPFIEQWINTACPRIGFDDNLDANIVMINITDAMYVKELLSKNSVLTRA